MASVGGALRGNKNVRGNLSKDILRDTRLKLDASPLPGSVILAISPEQSPAEELNGEDTAMIDPKEDQLLDQIFPRINDLIEHIVSLPEDPTQELAAEKSALANTLRSMGPRVASSLRRLADVSADSDFSVDITWEQPLKPTIRTPRLVPSVARRASALISNSSTDKETVEISGIMRTVSDIEELAITPLENVIAGKPIHVSGIDLPESALDGIGVSASVVITATVTRTSETFVESGREKYKATSIDLK